MMKLSIFSALFCVLALIVQRCQLYADAQADLLPSNTNAWSTAGNTHIVGILPMRASPFISLVITTSETETVNFTVSSLSQRIANGSVTSGTPTHISDSILISYAVSNESDRYKGILVSTGTDKTLSVTVVMMDSFNSAGVYVNYPISVCTVNNHSYVYYAVSIGTTETTSFSSLLIVSGNNNTNITITPTVTVTIPPNLTQSGHQTVLNAGQSITIQLQYLETLLLKPVVALADLTGTKVESSKPLSVYSGHTCGVIPPDRDDCDFVGEQLPPVVSWGKEFLVQSFYNRQSGYILKIIGSQSSTNIDITCADGSNYSLSLQEGGVLNQTVSQTSCYINSTSPILVAQFVLGFFPYMYEPGDSAMTIIPPLHQYGNNVTSFSLISLLGAPVSVNLVVLAADESSQIQLNGTVLPSLTSSSWKRYNSSVGGSYVFNSTIIEDIDFGGNYIVEIRVWSNNSNDKILAMVYGLGRLFGYSYTGTLNQSPIEAYEGEYCQDLNSIVPNTPPVIEASDTFMITVGEKALYTLHITDPGDTISVTIDGEFPYTLDQNGSIWTLNVTLSSFVEFSFSVIASDSFNATSVITPQVRICGCPADRGNCTFEGVQNASSNPLILICNCIEAYKGDYCEDDFDGCTEVSCFNDATCTDVPAPGTGATCPPCPSGYTGDGIVCNVTLVTLPYILFNSSISEVTNITRHYLYSTWRVNAPRPINLLGSAYSSIYISISGTFSMNGRFNYLYSTLFPSSTHGIRDSVVFAPMWNFYDIRREGSISYQTFSSNNPLANEVFNDVNSFIRASKNITSYKGIWMLVMEWKDVHPYPHGSYYYYYYYYYNEILEKHNTFQAILTTDGSDTHIIYTYKCGDIMWDNYYSRSVVGYNIAGGRYENHRGSGIPGELLKLGCNDDMNQPANYTNIVYSFQSDEKSPFEALCLERYRNDLELPEIPLIFAIPCPCSAWQVWFDRSFRFTYYYYSDTQYVECYSNRFSQFYQSMCCYSFTFPSWGALIVNGPYSSHVFRYNPFFNNLNYTRYDDEFHSTCCIRTQNCELFRERRPVKTCTGYVPPRRTWFWGDPHINTLDGATYTFNGLGEYVLLRTINADFEIQARTKLATPNTTATVFSAVALTSDKDRTEVVEIQADNDDNQNFIVLYNGNDVSTNLSTVNDTLDYNTVSLARETQDVISVALSSGVSLNATLRLGILSFTMVVPETYMTETMGLQGNFDGDKTNDFVNREGNMIPYNSSDADIYHNFGQTWQVQNDTESLLTYATGETFANYSNPNHVPVFLDQIDSETRVEAERICGGSNKIECIFDYSQTKNEELALDTQTTMEQNELKKQIGNNLPPVIEASDTFMLTVGETALYTINITDPGDTISVTIDGEFPHTLDQDGSIWTLNVTHSSLVKFSFNVIASDSFNATSVITPQVRICGCPADRGNCTIEGVQNASSNPLILICDCIEAYEGEYCEGDFDGCTEVSCFNDATCTDVPAPGTGATCPPCPNGYTGDGLICDDIDECDSSSTSNCSHFCNNTIGSYHCTCMPGYELHSDGRSCNEIDECERLLDNCQQECMNTDGSFSCSCFDGFLLQDDGRSCKNDPSRECLDDNECEQFCVYDNYTETENCSCQSGYNLSSNMENCTDIDECSATNPCTQICNNAIGSFGCNCLDGFQLQSDGFTCTDIDECLVLSSCSEPRIRCVNSPGSFDCFCPLGTEFQDGSCTVILQPVRSSSSESFHMSSLPKNPSLSYSFSFFSSTTPSPSSIPTVPANSGVVVVLNGTNASTFDVESFKNVTAEALNEYCSSNNCTSAFLQNRKRSATNSIIEPDDIVITETTETSNGLKVTFYVKGKSGTPVDASAVVAAIKAADSRYVNAGFTIASLTLLNPPSTTIVVTPTASATPTDDGLSAGQIAGITIGVVIGTLLMIMIIISVACLICYRKRSNKVINRENNSDFTVENQYQETIPPTPAGSVRSIKLKLAQDFDSSDEDESESEDDLKSIIMNERVNLGGQVESFGVMPEESKETFL